MYPKRRTLAKARAAVCLLLAMAILAACSSDRLSSLTSSPPALQGKADLPGLAPGIIVITSSADSAEISADPPNRRVQSASEGAGDATRSFLNTPNLGNPQLEAGVGAVQFALAPFAAAYGAISARQLRLSPGEISDAQQQLAQIMKSNAVPEALGTKGGRSSP